MLVYIFKGFVYTNKQRLKTFALFK